MMSNPSFAAMRQEIEAHLRDTILPFWKSLRDDEHGGYVSFVGYDLARDPQGERGCILNSRILWFFSQAVITLGDKSLLPYAEHAYKALQSMTDPVNGGVYWSMHADGTVLDSTKHTYNQAFAIYALSYYAKASGDKTARDRAFDLFDIIETKCRDEGGYLEAFTADFRPESNEKLSENGVMATRTMNTLLHVLEAYTGLYDVTRDARVGDALRFALDIFEKHMYNPVLRRQEVFFDHEYNTLIDLHSFGHDIETSWLADRTLEILGDDELTARLRPILMTLANQTYKVAFDPVKGFANECERGVVNQSRIWWVQAEALVGFLNAYEKTGEARYLDAALSQWSTIKRIIIDPRPGSEWFWCTDADGVPNADKPIVEPWKCPYHNGRMAFEVIERSKHAHV